MNELEKSRQPFTVSNWYGFGFLNPFARLFVMAFLALALATCLIFFIIPLKYAVFVYAIWFLVFMRVFFLFYNYHKYRDHIG